MRVAVLEVVARREQRAGCAQVAADRAVGGHELLVDDRALPAEPRPVGAVHACAVDREDGVDAILLAELEIVLAVVGRHVDESGAGVRRDELAGEERARLCEEPTERVHRVACGCAFELRTKDLSICNLLQIA